MSDEQRDNDQVDSLAKYLETATPQFIDDDLMVVIMHNAARAAANVIRRLTAERDAARAEVERLRAACEGVPEMLATAANQIHPHTFQRYVGKYRAAADAIHAVLENEAADGEGVRG